MIRLFVNQYTDADPTRDAELAECRAENATNPDIGQVISLEGRPTFNDFFAKINEVAESDDISIIANSDIYFDLSLKYVDAISSEECFVLARWDVQSNSEPVLFDRRDAQDCWIFRGKVKPISGDFALGMLGCDNAILDRIEAAGYKVSNPAKTIKAFHLHLSGIRNYSRADSETISPPYLFIKPHELGEEPVYERKSLNPENQPVRFAKGTHMCSLNRRLLESAQNR